MLIQRWTRVNDTHMEQTQQLLQILELFTRPNPDPTPLRRFVWTSPHTLPFDEEQKRRYTVASSLVATPSI